MAKTGQTGVRFDKELLDAVKEKGLASSPQKALNLYQEVYKKYAAGVFQEPKEEKKSENMDGWIPPHPKREDYADAFDFADAKNDWKKKYNL